MGLCRRGIPNYPDGLMNEPRTGNRVADRGCSPIARGDNGRVLRSRYGPAHSHRWQRYTHGRSDWAKPGRLPTLNPGCTVHAPCARPLNAVPGS